MDQTKALVIGGADCVWEDVLQLEEIYGKQWDGLVIAANDVGAHWPRELHHWVSLHPVKFRAWLAIRKSHRFSCEDIVTWSQESRWKGTRRDHRYAQRQLIPWGGGSSGMLATQVARELGCTRIVLCGVPLTRTPHFNETTERFHSVWVSADGHWRAWKKNLHLMRDWVRSMSGRTRELLGAPEGEWLRDAVARPLDETL